MSEGYLAMSVIKIIVLNLLTFLLLISCSQSPKLSNADKEIVFLMLSQTPEVKIHQMRGATKNKVYLHKDGHKEAVYDENGILVQDGINDGSYNYANPKSDPFGHYTQDIHPWIIYGMSPNDPTTKPERIHAYMLDLEAGIIKARELWPDTSIASFETPQANTKLPKVWTKVLKNPETRKLLRLIRGDIELTDDNLISTLELIHNAFNEVY